MTQPKQGEVWDIDFAEGFRRPGVVVSRNELNRGRLILVVPCTSSQVPRRRQLPTHVFLDRGIGGLTEPTVAQAHLIQPVDIAWLLRKRGELGEETLAGILRALAWVVDLFPD